MNLRDLNATSPKTKARWHLETQPPKLIHAPIPSAYTSRSSSPLPEQPGETTS